MKKTEKDWKSLELFLTNTSETEKAVSDNAMSPSTLFFKKNDYKVLQNNSLTKNQNPIIPQFDSLKAFKKLDEKIKKLS